MSQSVLLDLARHSIEEVLEARRIIDTKNLRAAYPVLEEKIASAVTLFLGDEIRSHYSSLHPKKALIDDLIYNAKVAAFETAQFPPLSTSEYLHVSLQVSLLSPLEPIDADPSLIEPRRHGVVMRSGDNEAYISPDAWGDRNSSALLDELRQLLNIDTGVPVQLYRYEVQSAKSSPILR